MVFRWKFLCKSFLKTDHFPWFQNHFHVISMVLSLSSCFLNSPAYHSSNFFKNSFACPLTFKSFTNHLYYEGQAKRHNCFLQWNLFVFLQCGHRISQKSAFIFDQVANKGFLFSISKMEVLYLEWTPWFFVYHSTGFWCM